MQLGRLIAALAAPLLLTGCLLAPGKFTSTMDIGQDGTFTFTYVGEVHALNMGGMGDALKGMGSDDEDAVEEEPTQAFWQDKNSAPLTAPELEPDQDDDWSDGEKKNGTLLTEREKAALAEALSKEKGYRKVEYRGDDMFFVDYSITGRLDHSFLFPYNLDAEVIFPFVVAEMRANGNVRVKAPAFAKANSRMDMSGMDRADDRIDGTFTLTTDAEIVSQNNEEGADMADRRRRIVWTISPLTADAPSAVLKLNP